MTLTRPISSLMILAVLPIGCAHPVVQEPEPEVFEVERPSGGLATMYFHDPLSCKLSFEEGAEGGVIQDYMIKNAGSDIDFGHYNQGQFTVGIEGGREGVIVDLGSGDDLKERYGFAETVGGGQGFASIRMEEGALVVLADYDEQTVQPLGENTQLFAESRSRNSSAPIGLGHIYVLRLVDRHDPEFSRIVKFKVVEYTPDVSVTLRWVRIHETE